MEDDPIETTLDGALQELAQQAVQRGVERLARVGQDRYDRAGRGPWRVGQRATGTIIKIEPSALVVRLDDAADAADGSKGETGVLGVLPLPPPIFCAGHSVEGARVQDGPGADWPAQAEKRFQVGERLSVRIESVAGHSSSLAIGLTLALAPQAALVALDPRTRDILALVGGYGGRPGDFDRASQGLRQAGSTFKPLVFAAALASGRHVASEEVEDLPRIYPSQASQASQSIEEGPPPGWRPRNFTGTYQGPMRLRAALAHSINTVAVHLLSDTGIARVVALGERLGIPAQQMPRDLTLALGTALVSPLQLAGAYAVFADTLHGRYLPPRLFADEPRLDPDPPAGEAAPKTAIDHRGASPFAIDHRGASPFAIDHRGASPFAIDHRGASPFAIDPALSYLMTSLLQSVVNDGSGSKARELGIPGLAGKTGTTSQGHDAWFVGYHPDLLAVVWVGDDSEGPQRIPGAQRAQRAERTGADTALPIWLDFMRAAQATRGKPAPWPRPPGLREVTLPEGGSELLLTHTP